MLKSYGEMKRERNGIAISKEEALWEIAREMSKKNDLLEIDMLCKTADVLRGAAKGSLGDLHVNGFIWAEELACLAHKKICKITGCPQALCEEGSSEDEEEE